MVNRYYLTPKNELYHYGVKGMKWGVRRYQNKDGTLTAAGKERQTYDKNLSSARAHIEKEFGSAEAIKRHRDWMDKTFVAYDKWYFNEDDTQEPILRKEYDQLLYEHPEAKRYESSIQNYIYNQASARLRKSLDDARQNNYNREWTTQRDNTEGEYNGLYLAYNTEYNNKMYEDVIEHSTDELRHYGVLGMKWGVRRYQNKDGTLTEAGKKRVQEGTEMFPYAGKKRRPTMTQRHRALDRTERYKWEELEEYNKSIGNTWDSYSKRNPNYDKIFQKHYEKNFPNSIKKGYKSYGEPYEYWQAHFQDVRDQAKIYKKWSDRFVKEYADATLDDLNLRSTSDARAYAEEWVRKQWRISE